MEGEDHHHGQKAYREPAAVVANSPRGRILALSADVQTLLLKSECRNGSVEKDTDQTEKSPVDWRKCIELIH